MVLEKGKLSCVDPVRRLCKKEREKYHPPTPTVVHGISVKLYK